MGRFFYSVIFFCAFLSFQTSGLGQTFTLIKDINVGSLSSCLGTKPQPLNLTEAGGSLYFTTGFTNPVLWKSDGTAAGTIRVKEFTGMDNIKLSRANSKLIISGRDPGTAEYQLWTTDGTEAGTVYVFGWGLNNHVTGDIVSSNGFIYLHMGATNELWRSDGTAVGTILLKSFAGVSNMTDVNGTLFFSGDGQLWKSNGTAPGTILVKNAAVVRAIAGNGILFFVGYDNVNGYELWKSDGTEAGTFLLKDIEPGFTESNIGNFGVSNNMVYFFATTTANGLCLWKSDGTSVGTVLVKDLSDAGYSSLFSENKLTDCKRDIIFSWI